MKNLYKNPAVFGRLVSLLGIIAIGTVIGLGLTGCPTDDEGPVPNTLVITGITATQYSQGSTGCQIAIVPVGTAVGSIATSIVAGADSSEDSVTLSGSSEPYTASASLYAAPDYQNRWTGSGVFDVYLLLGGSNYYRAQNVSFTSATTTVAATSFQQP
jgi:hypothetical protein